MLLRNSISNTKKFFHKTLHSFKSLFSTGYHRLPKTTPHSPFSYSAHTLMHIQMHMDDKELDSEKEKSERRSKEKEAYSESPVQMKKKKKQMGKREEYGYQNNRKSISHQEGMREERNFLVERKLRELEMLDMGNVDYVMDIEEVLHYYSRLTCPAYLEIVDKFFLEMYSEFFLPISLLD